MVTTILVMTNFAMFRYRYGLIGTFVDSFNANTDKTILVIVMIFCITIIVAVKFQYCPSQSRRTLQLLIISGHVLSLVILYSGLFLRRKIFMNWPIQTFQGGDFMNFQEHYQWKMILVNISRVKFL